MMVSFQKQPTIGLRIPVEKRSSVGNKKKVGIHLQQAVLEDVMKKTGELLKTPTCASETKKSAERWLDAVGTERQAAETERYLAALEEDIMPIDNLIGFADSEAGAAYFGAEKAAEIAAHAHEIKAAGAKYCDCPACLKVAEILAAKEAMLH
jgi:hypothetical protein